MRDLTVVIDQLIKVAPELEARLSQIKRAIEFTAPEIMKVRWREVQTVLVAEIPPGHPKHMEVLAIWNDTPNQPKTQYTEAIDRVIYDGASIAVVPEEDWPGLALAILSQADLDPRAMSEIRGAIARAGHKVGWGP